MAQSPETVRSQDIQGAVCWLTALLVIAFSTLLTRPVSAQTNLLINPSFVKMSGEMPEGWSNWQRDSGAVTFTIDRQALYNGKPSFRVSSKGNGDWSASQTHFIRVDPGDIYCLSGWVKCDGNENGSISLHTCDVKGNTSDWVAAIATNTAHGWHRLMRSFIIPADIHSIQFRFTGSGKGSAWFADPTLVRIGNAYDTVPRAAIAADAAFIAPDTKYKIERNDDSLVISTAQLRFVLFFRSGLWSVRWTNQTLLSSVACQTQLADGQLLNSLRYTGHSSAESDFSEISDGIGNGIQVIVHHRAADRPELRQSFQIYPGKAYLLTRLEVVSPTPISSNNISPLACDNGVTPGAGVLVNADGWLRTLFVPFGSGTWFGRFRSDIVTNSNEVTAIFDNKSRQGLVIGSVTHDTWKTGIEMDHASMRKIGALRVFGGETNEWTEDTEPHGFLSGNIIASPLIFVGSFEDWRDGMEAYGKVNAVMQPALPWDGGVPVGWNSWSAYAETIDYAHYSAVADYLKNVLQPRGFGNKGLVYVNLDGMWSNLSPEEMKKAVNQIHANGQKAGVLLNPFTHWATEEQLKQKVETISGGYTWWDLLLKDADGRPIQLGETYAVDPTHPGNIQLVRNSLSYFVSQGFDYIKLDWLYHGTFEGRHFDPKITTGIQAYNYGMQDIVNQLDPKKIGRPFFVSLSSVPMFPGGYGHSRRISCDANFGTMDETEYMLNTVTYGWWLSGTVYRYNDPDMFSLWKPRGHREISEQEARTRINATAVAGTVFLDSDDLTDSQARDRAIKLLCNRDILALACSGVTFRPVEGDTGDRAAHAFVRHDPGAGLFYLAIFNYNAANSMQKTLSFARLGLDNSKTYQMRNLWTGQITAASHAVRVDLKPLESEIYCFTAM